MHTYEGQERVSDPQEPEFLVVPSHPIWSGPCPRAATLLPAELAPQAAAEVRDKIKVGLLCGEVREYYSYFFPLSPKSAYLAWPYWSYCTLGLAI